MGSDGRPQGDALVEFEGEQDLEKAKELNNQSMGRRYIEVTPISRDVAETTLAGQPGVSIVSVCECIYVFVGLCIYLYLSYQQYSYT